MNDIEFPLVWDSTRLAALRACKRQFELGHLMALKTKGTSVHLHAGAAFAHGLEVTRRAFYAEGANPADAIAKGAHALITSYGDFDHGTSAKSCDRMVGALEYYFSEYPLESDPAKIISLGGKPAIEFSFAIPLPITHPLTSEPLLYCGRFDAVVDYAGGIYAMDEKTTSSLGASWPKQWDMRGQFAGYAWALKEHGVEAAGTIVAGVSILKSKYEQQRVVVSQPEWKIAEWYADMLSDIEEAKAIYSSGARWKKNWSESCNSYGSCSYKQLCVVRDPAPWIETYYERNEWNPLKVVEAT